jgi:hypothetical protein
MVPPIELSLLPPCAPHVPFPRIDSLPPGRLGGPRLKMGELVGGSDGGQRWWWVVVAVAVVVVGDISGRGIGGGVCE